MKKLLLSLTLLVGVVGMCHAVGAEKPRAPKTGQYFEDPSLLGFKVTASSHTGGVLVNSGQTLLYGICASSGAADGFAVAFDSASIAGLSATSVEEKKISPHVVTNKLSSAGLTQNSGCWMPQAGPARAENGLVIYNSASDIRAVIFWRKDDGSNP